MLFSSINKREVLNKFLRNRENMRWLVVKGNSMKPFLYDGQYVSLDKNAEIRNSIQRGTIVAFDAPERYSKVFIKRIIGLPRESIELVDQDILINDSPLRESYLKESFRFVGDFRMNLGDEEYFVLGDNRQDSMDSRRYGGIHLSRILGVVWFRLWPPTKFEYSERNSNSEFTRY